jgi:protein-tyrosine phosphatase
MRHVFWLLPGILGGRPGPNREPWRVDELRNAGVGAVLSVNDGESCHTDDLAAVGIDYRCLPLSANAPPREGDLEHCRAVLPQAYAFVMDKTSSDIPCIVHCSSGKDRTGLFMAYFLIQSPGLEPIEAIARVMAVRPIALSAEGWDRFALDVLSQESALAFHRTG